MENQTNNTFKIGIAMAGAVSAGAYTAGVIDYLLETLSKWEGAKERNKQLGPGHKDYDPSVPMHDVIIEVMGGASAGGMTAAISALGLFEGLRPVNDKNPDKAQNKLYDAWVRLYNQDGSKMATLKQMLETDDITQEQGVISVLNSRPIDAIADKASQLSRIAKLPDYISPELEIIMTLTSLRGIPLAVNFYDQVKQQRAFSEPPKPAHRMYLHKGIAHFKTGVPTDHQPAHTLPFNPESEADRHILLECAKATGAFPLGLAPRLLAHIPKTYLTAMVHRMFQKQADAKDYLPSQGLRIEMAEDHFDFYAVDGGTVNNEPFGEVIRSLQEKCSGDPGRNYAVLMIDPFPDFEAEAEAGISKKTPTLVELAPQLLGAIRGQAMMKESDLVGGLSDDHTLRMVFPSRWENEERDPYPISCGSLDGFGGFFSLGFREHDFALGRKNCQSFLRNYFCLSTSRTGEDSVFRDWDANDPRHQRYYSPDVDGYPIIPDMDYDARRAENPELPTPERQRISVREVLALERPIKRRLKKVLDNVQNYPKTELTQEQESLKRDINKILSQKHKYRDNHPLSFLYRWPVRYLLNPLISLLSRFLFIPFAKFIWGRMLTNSAARWATSAVLKTILADFKKRGLLDEGKQ